MLRQRSMETDNAQNPHAILYQLIKLELKRFMIKKLSDTTHVNIRNNIFSSFYDVILNSCSSNEFIWFQLESMNIL